MNRINIVQFWRNVGNILADDGMTWSGLAEIAGLSPQSLSSAKHVGSDLRIGTLLRICRALDVTPLELLEGIKRPRPVAVKKATADLLNIAWKVDTEASIMMLMNCLEEQDQIKILESAKRYLKGDNE